MIENGSRRVVETKLNNENYHPESLNLLTVRNRTKSHLLAPPIPKVPKQKQKQAQKQPATPPPSSKGARLALKFARKHAARRDARTERRVLGALTNGFVSTRRRLSRSSAVKEGLERGTTPSMVSDSGTTSGVGRPQDPFLRTGKAQQKYSRVPTASSPRQQR